MKRFEFSYFDAVEWSYQRAVLYANNAQEAEAFLRKDRGPYRISHRPYRSELEDSLKLIYEADLGELPIIVSIDKED